MRRITVLLPAAFLLTFCASGGRPANLPGPGISVTQAAPIFFGSGTTAPMTLDVRITNRAQVPLRVREIEITSPGMGQYTLIPVTKQFNEVIPPGENRTVGLVATVVASRTRLQQTEPLAVRTIVLFEAEGKSFREVVLHQFAGPN